MQPSDPAAAQFNVLTETRHGPFLYNRHDVYIGRALERYGEWSEGELALLGQVVRPGMVVVDAGANIGTHTVPLARAVGPRGLVYAFEPQRLVYQTLAANVALNSLTNVYCQQRALGATAGIARLPALDYAAPNNFGGVELGPTLAPATEAVPDADAAPTPAGEPVEVARLDDFGLAACHLIKVDVEGMELAVLRGALDTIRRCQPALYVEADREDRRDAVIWWLDDHGYALYWHAVPLYSAKNYKGNPEDIFPGIVSLNLLALPKSIPQEVAGLERVAVPRRRTLVRRKGSGGRPVPVTLPLRRVGAPPPGPAGRQQGPRAPEPPHLQGQSHPRPHPHPHDHPTGPAPAASPAGSVGLRALLEAAVLHHQTGRFAEAAAAYETVLAAVPDEPDALHLLGLIRREERRYADALALIRRAATVVPTQPLFLFNLGAVLRQVGQLAEAERHLRQALALSPDSVEARLELALTLLDGRDLPAAEALFRESLVRAPEHAATHFALAGLLLLGGRYDDGWREFAWRWRLPELVGPQPPSTAPRWQGEPLTGRTILLEAEQGHGDTFQFARYIPLVAERGGRVLLRCRPEVRSLLAALPDLVETVVPGEPLPPHDHVAALPDLPRIFGTTPTTIPGPHPYLHANPARVAAWVARLADDQARPGASDAAPGGRGPVRVGLVWAGSPDHRLNVQRSASLADFAPLAEAARAFATAHGRALRFYALQKGAPAAEAGTPPPGLDLVDLGPDLTDFAETAAAVAALDLVITVDTSVGHLAGALGRPVWVLPWATHDWRWLLDRDDSPWYPSVRLFRQSRPNAWGPVLERVAAVLAAWTP